MIEKENFCVGCTSMGLPCRGSACENYEDQIVVSCDECGLGDKIYQDGDQQLCAYCLAYKHKSAFIETFIDEIMKSYAEEFAKSNYDEVDVNGFNG